jgi:hypothetical protein
MKEIVSGKGSKFLRCQKSQTDRRFQKYPPQPVMSLPRIRRSVLRERERKKMSP